MGIVSQHWCYNVSKISEKFQVSGALYTHQCSRILHETIRHTPHMIANYHHQYFCYMLRICPSTLNVL